MANADGKRLRWGCAGVTWLLILVVAVLVALFAGQNTDPVSIRFLGWQTGASQAVIILVSAAAGAGVAAAASLIQRIRFNLRIWDLQGKTRKLEQEKAELSQRLQQTQERLQAAEQRLQETASSRPQNAGDKSGSYETSGL